MLRLDTISLRGREQLTSKKWYSRNNRSNSKIDTVLPIGRTEREKVV